MKELSITRPEFLESASNRLSDEISSADHSSIFVLCDEHTHQYCWPKLKAWYPQHFSDEQLIITKAGEAHKNLRTAEFIWSSLVEQGADRHSLLINLGGGMITDLGAFAASLYQRGIEFIHIPTSLLAIVDAAIGGKTGVDFGNLKNQIGNFQAAKAILVFSEFLKTLSDEEYLSGLAEVYKHALINDKALWDKLVSDPNGLLSQDLIQRAVAIKFEIVQQDPFELSNRKILNFGHSIGHAIESSFLAYGNPVSHGFAIAAGMICEAYLSNALNELEESEFHIILKTLKKRFPKLEWSENDEPEMVAIMRKDKKNKAGRIQMVLLDSIGNASYDHQLDEARLLAALQFYRKEC